MTQDPRSPQEEQSSTPAARDFSHAWRALRHRNFRLFFGGQSISLIGTWMTRIATSWLVYRLTKSALLLGTVGFAGQIPTFLLAPLAGVLVDRIDRRKVLVWTQTLAMVQSLALAWLTLIASHHHPRSSCAERHAGHHQRLRYARPPVLHGQNGRGSRRPLQRHRHQLVHGQHGALIGPSLAGLLIAATNEGWCFLVDGISYIAVIASLLMMRLRA